MDKDNAFAKYEFEGAHLVFVGTSLKNISHKNT